MPEHPAPTPVSVTPCRWRTAAETLDVVESLERIESLLRRLESRLSAVEAAGASAPALQANAGARAAEDAGR